MTVREGGELEKNMQRAEEMNKGGEGTSSVEPLTGVHRRVQRWRGAMIRRTAPALGSSSSKQWEEKPSERTATAEERLGSGHALRNG